MTNLKLPEKIETQKSYLMKFIDFPGYDPALNLGLEEWLFTSMEPSSDGYLLLWQNDPAIIIGRHQVAPEVINRLLVEEKNLSVIRRMTGGGAVYHDHGNLNFSFLENAPENGKIDFHRYLEPVCRALAEFGVKAEISGRNDIEAGGKKISGSAQIVRSGKTLHHSTLLVDADLEAMSQALKVPEEKYRSKGVASHKARVSNLNALAPSPIAIAALKEALARHCGAAKASLPANALQEAETLAEVKYRSWEWNFGKSPKYDVEKKRRFPWGEIAVHLETSGGVIRRCQISGDFFSSGNIPDLAERFENVSFTPEDIRKRISSMDWEYWFTGCHPQMMEDFFLREIFK